MAHPPDLPTIPPARSERRETGRALRAKLPLEQHAELHEQSGRDPIALLRSQDVGRVVEYVPIRWGRMSASPFAFYRGAAATMAADLGAGPNTAIEVQLCGDAHAANFGVFAAPDRRLVFDVNDFDETFPGPFEWDVKRLAASMVLAGEDNGFTPAQSRRAAATVGEAYRQGIARAASLDPLDAWYFRVEVDDVAELEGAQSKRVSDEIMALRAKAGRKDRHGAALKLSEVVDGRRRIRPDPPLITRLDADDHPDQVQFALNFYEEYLQSLPAEWRRLLDRYALCDLGFKVVGVGSVGTRCLIALLVTGDDEPIILQFKEATASVLEPYVASVAPTSAGQRVVDGQRLIQSATDGFLGWTSYRGVAGVYDFYVRQLWDGKASPRLDRMNPKGLVRYARLCGAVLARAHARSGDAAMIDGYLGGADDTTFDEAIATFSERYAERSRADYALALAAIADGSIPTASG